MAQPAAQILEVWLFPSGLRENFPSFKKEWSFGTGDFSGATLVKWQWHLAATRHDREPNRLFINNYMLFNEIIADYSSSDDMSDSVE